MKSEIFSFIVDTILFNTVFGMSDTGLKKTLLESPKGGISDGPGVSLKSIGV